MCVCVCVCEHHMESMFVTGTLETEVNKGEKSHPISTTQRHTPIVEIFMQNDLSRLNAFMEKFSLKKKNEILLYRSAHCFPHSTV